MTRPSSNSKNNNRKPKRKLAVIDFETDPFKYGRVPSPFCVEFYSDEITQVFWGDDCADNLANFLERLDDEYIIYAHNGGKFDFHFLLNYIDNPALIIKTRIVECKIFHHTLRDSYAILPVPLRDYEKQDFSYDKMERPVREQNKAEILEYLHSDCLNLYSLVSDFISTFGYRMTIGGTAIREIQKLHPFIKSGSAHDATFRKYYYGGRVQCFKSGIIPGPIKLFDVNSMYPSAMRNKLHPINGRFDWSNTRPNTFDMPYFLQFRGRNTNALPSISGDGSLIFTRKEGIFNACSHEIEIALEHGLIEIDEVLECLISTEAISFDSFVDKFYEQKTICKREGNKSGELFAKLLLNSGYGRFGINPENFADWIIHRDFGNEEELIAEGFKSECDYETIELWSRPAEIQEENFCDVSVAASITSAARATLLTGLQNSIDALYCDTDSIICRDFVGDIDKYRLGAWDLEKESKYVAIAGKKMYALYDRETDDKAIKLSSKGGTLKLADILSICRGETVNYENDAPTFSLKRQPTFVSRRFKQTA